MSLWFLLIIVFISGGVGGVINALISDNGFMLPQPVSTESGGKIIRPGFIGNIFIGGVSACISWGLYGPFAAAVIAGIPAEAARPEFGLTLSGLVGAALIGVGGARWLTNEVDKTLLREAAVTAADSGRSPSLSKSMAMASPAVALYKAQENKNSENN